ncbi:MAG: PocR ligand-binding domain-containing protein [Proteobacteria bacterium]|nr:PocR ligand-binding domain-containing protein [Pseudomonadota bacterium]
MKLTDILPIEKWIELEQQIHEQSGLNPTIYDTKGVSITRTTTWPNALCPEIKAIPKGQTFICSSAHQNIAGDAESSREPVVEACDAGLVKIVVPIFLGDTFLGAAGGCGLLMDGEEVESFLVSKTLDMDEDKIEELAKSIPVLSEEKAWDVARFIKNRIDAIVTAYTK